MKSALELNRIYVIEIVIIMLGGYSRKSLKRQYKIKISRDNLGEQKVLESAFSEFQTA